MGRIQTFNEFLATQSVEVPLWGFVFNLALAACISFVLSFIYVKYGTSLSNRKLFAKNFVLITMTTMLMITIVKSSLALSLGLVGALSIVRFRAAIKEPEELAYLFLTIAIGLGFGADQRLITIVACAIICCVIVMRSSRRRDDDSGNYYMTITCCNKDKLSLEKILEILKKHFSLVNMKRFDEADSQLEAALLVEFDNVDSLNNVREELYSIDNSLKLTFMDNKGIIH